MSAILAILAFTLLVPAGVMTVAAAAHWPLLEKSDRAFAALFLGALGAAGGACLWAAWAFA